MIQSSDELGEQFSAQKLMTQSKKSNLRQMLPPIQMPTVKRSVLGIQNSQRKYRQKKSNQKQLKGKPNKGSIANLKGQSFSVNKWLQARGILTTQEIGKYTKCAQILSYIYSQFSDLQPEEKKIAPKYMVYEKWELQQIKQNYKDTNLGDFIIKMVNPDLLPAQYLAQGFEKKDKVPLKSAEKIYQSLFNVQYLLDKNLQSCQFLAFRIAFKLCRQNSIRIYGNQRLYQLQKMYENFIGPYEYFLKIEQLSSIQYYQLKKKPDFIEKAALYQSDQLKSLYDQFQKDIDKSDKLEGESIFTEFKGKVYMLLRKMLIVTQDNDFKKLVIKRAKSISKLLSVFPDLIAQIKDNTKDTDDLKLAGGGFLSRESHEGQLKWIIKKNNPSDLLTLLRKFLMYKLTQRGGLFIRSFLSKSQNYIFLVIKASEQHLQKMAQQSNFNMQVEMGSIDAFSFEPVDKYARPLRCNKFIRDVAFIRKYNLAYDKKDKDEDLGAKSVESEALNIYNKAIQMNKEELRAKIILDQQQCDSCFSWLSNKLGIRYVNHDEILNNSQNEQEVDDNIWPLYYIYNKMMIQYISRLRDQISLQKGNKAVLQSMNNNIGLTLRLMFLKALNFCNDMYRKHRKTNFKSIKNLFLKKYPLETIWNQMGENSPRGYHPYFYSSKLQKIWRKYEINQQKERSKFNPASRLIITNKLIRQYVNISKSLATNLITDFYPIHDPFVLKHIKVRPYLNVLNNMISNQNIQMMKTEEATVKLSQTFVQFQCDYTKEDFTKQSLTQKLSYKLRGYVDFSVNSVAFYCGEKLAFFFQLRRYLTEMSWPLFVPAFIIQVIFWVENTHIQQTGASSLTSFNTVLMIILVLINTIWTEYVVSTWESRQNKLARSYGTNDLSDESQQNKRVLFEGQMKRNMETNELNDEYENKLTSVLKEATTFFINFVYIVLVGSSILIVFVLKSILIQKGYPQQTVTMVPSILISLLTVMYNFFYRKINGVLVQFENKKTVNQYQASLTYKSFLVTFVVTYFALFIYTFFQQYFESKTTCTITTDSGITVNNCYYYISGQLVTQSLIDLFLTVIMAFVPLLKFYYTGLQIEKKEKLDVTYNLNYFESIDTFEEQDRMDTYMYNDQIDRTWEGYTVIVISFTTLCLFAPFVPLLYVMMYATGVVFLNAKKYEIIYFSKRILPLKVNSIGIWLVIIKIVSVIGVFVNVALVVFIRDNSLKSDQSIIYFGSVFAILLIKYLISFSGKGEDSVGKRCKLKIQELMTEKSSFNLNAKNDLINTDIQNLYYDQQRLDRKLPNLKGANIKYKR